MPITAALINLLKSLNLTEDAASSSSSANTRVYKAPKAFNPKTLLRHLSAKHEEYAQATQQDAHEILRHLIDGVYMEELDVRARMADKGPPRDVADSGLACT